MTNKRLLAVADIVGRISLCLYFGYLVVMRMSYVTTVWHTEPDPVTRLVTVASESAVVLFMALFCATVITRLPPLRAPDRVEPYVTALAGTFLMGLIVYLPPVEVPVWARLLALVLVMAGMLLSAYVILWLGRSVSIMPEARRLVTGGPYSIIRHPLYLTEEIAMIGVVIMNFSVWSVLIGIAHWCLQLRRMYNEEEVLQATFPDYLDYMRRVPRVIPIAIRSDATI